MSERWVGSKPFISDPEHGVVSNHGEYCFSCRILRQCTLPREQRTIPAPQESVVYDRAYSALLESGKLRWVRTVPNCQSFSDYVVTA